MPDAIPTVDDAQAAHRREQNRIRVARHRARKAGQQALSEAVNAVASLDDTSSGARPSRAKSKTALLRNSLVKHSITVDRVIAKRASALEATRYRQVVDEVREMPDFPTQLRASTDLTHDLQAAGEYPTDVHPGAGSEPIVVNVLVLNGGKSEMVPLPLPQSLQPSRTAPIVVHAGSSRDEALQKSKVKN